MPRPDLLHSLPDDRDLVVEIDDDRGAHLRFGDGQLGALPAIGTTFAARYRVGGGPGGNVGREAISVLVLRDQAWSGLDVRPRNPLPATGGTAQQPVGEARLLAPGAFRLRQRRAITADDYAAAARELPGVQSAAAGLAWTGSWYEARVALDAVGTDVAGPDLLAAAAAALEPLRRLGHDVAVRPATQVPVDLEVAVCVAPHQSRAAVKADVLDVLSSRRLPGGRTGLFHPDRLTFGTPSGCRGSSRRCRRCRAWSASRSPGSAGSASPTGASWTTGSCRCAGWRSPGSPATRTCRSSAGWS
nr:baseplate J/gp47 family protein [Tessaracoccus coleopterorum]